MKDKLFKICGILLILTIVANVMITINRVSFASEIEGPAEDGYLMVAGVELFDAEYPEEVGTVDNATYDESSNTLILNNYNGGLIRASNMGKDFSIKLIGSNSIYEDPLPYQQSLNPNIEVVPGIIISNNDETVNAKIYGASKSCSLSASSNSIVIGGNLTVERCHLYSGSLDVKNKIEINDAIVYSAVINCGSLVENGNKSYIITGYGIENLESLNRREYYTIYSRNNSITINEGSISCSVFNYYLTPISEYGAGYYTRGENPQNSILATNVEPTYEGEVVVQNGDWDEPYNNYFCAIVLNEDNAKEFYQNYRIDVINVTTPIAGETPTVEGLEMSMADFDEVHLDKCYWFEEDHPEEEATVFEEGKTYGLHVEISVTVQNRYMIDNLGYFYETTRSSGRRDGSVNLNDPTLTEPVMFDEEVCDEMGFNNEPDEIWAVKYYTATAATSTEPEPTNTIEENTTTENTVITPTTSDTDKDVKDYNKDINNNGKTAKNPKTGDKLQKYLAYGSIGLILLMITIKLSQKYGRKARKIQF